MNCQYQERSNTTGSCPFAYSCDEECLYAYKYKAQSVESLQREVSILKDEILYAERNSEIDELQSDLDDMTCKYKSAMDLCRRIVESRGFSSDIKDEIQVTDGIEYEDKIELLNAVRDVEIAD